MTFPVIRRLPALWLAGIAFILGGGSLLIFTLFLFRGPLHWIDLGLDESSKLFLDAGLCLVFFTQHSGMVRGGFRQRLARLVPEQYHGAIYASASGIVLLVLVVLWQESARTLVATEGITRLVPRLAFVLSIGGFVWSICALGTTDPFGMRPTIDYLRGRESTQRELIVRGPYRWVRHPLYLSSLLMIWSSPDLTADRLLFNVLWTIWVVIGTHLEERNLVAILGETYRHYQCTVPALLPYRIPKPRNRHDSQSGPRGGVGMPLMDSGWATNVSESGDETPAA